jgi:hypothetical protein
LSRRSGARYGLGGVHAGRLVFEAEFHRGLRRFGNGFLYGGFALLGNGSNITRTVL